jgi:hypothetical protein
LEEAAKEEGGYGAWLRYDDSEVVSPGAILIGCALEVGLSL